MDEIGFRNWLEKHQTSIKLQSDFSSRIKRIERELGFCDIDEEFEKDKCIYLLGLFDNLGNNPNMANYPSVDFPIGKSQMGVFKHALTKYIQFKSFC